MEENLCKRSEEVQDIVDRMPTRLAAWTALVVFVLMASVIVLSFIIRYPDTVSGSISITGYNAPIRLVTASTGRLHLLSSNAKSVKEGQILAYIDNGAKLYDVIALSKILDHGWNDDTSLYLPNNLVLGDLSASYNSFVLSYEQWQMLKKTKVYANMRQSLQTQINTDEKVVLNMEKELQLKKKTLSMAREKLAKDSLLKMEGAISGENYNSSIGNFLALQEADMNMQSSRLQKLSEIDRSGVEQSKVGIEEEEALQKAYTDVQAKYNNLTNDLKQWKERCLLIAPVSGSLEFLGFWRENSFVQTGQELFSILPKRNTLMGEARIALNGAGKVKVGQSANIKLNDYPYNEYGLIKGRVARISESTSKVATKEGHTEMYLVQICFPKGIVTNYGKRLSPNFEAKGTVDIITKPKRLIERLFDNLKAKQEK